MQAPIEPIFNPVFTDNAAFDGNGFFRSAFYEAFTQLSINNLLFQSIACLVILVIGIWAIRRIRARIITPKNQHTLFASFMVSIAGWALVVLMLAIFNVVLLILQENGKYLFITYFTSGGIALLMIRFMAWVFITAMRPNDLLRMALKALEWLGLSSIVLTFFGFEYPIINYLASIEFSIGVQVINLEKVIRIIAIALIVFAALGQLSRLIALTIYNQVEKGSLKANVGDLIVRVLNVLFFIIATFSILVNSGVASSNLAAFTSALGIGLGFGLQKIVINFLSGINVLIEGIIKKNDQIRIGNIAGQVISIKSQHIVVLEGNGVESIIPNSQLADASFQNLTLSDHKHCVKFQVLLSSVAHFVIFESTILEILKQQPRVLNDEKMGVEITGVYENVCYMDVFFWISDIENGTSSLISAILYLAATQLPNNIFATKTL